MIKTTTLDDASVRVTFALLDDGRTTALIGDFNGWDPAAHPLKKRSNGTRSVALVVPAGAALRFRYVADGDFFDDPEASDFEPNGFGQFHGVLVAA